MADGAADDRRSSMCLCSTGCSGGRRSRVARCGFPVVSGGVRRRGRRLDDRRAARRACASNSRANGACAANDDKQSRRQRTPHRSLRRLKPGASDERATNCFFCTLLLSARAPASRPAPYAQAERAERDVSWSELSRRQQRVLKNFEGQWGELPARTPRRAGQRGGSLGHHEPGESRRRLASGSIAGRELSNDERREIRHRYREFQELPRAQQRRIRNNFRRFRDLPPERRQELQQRWQDLPPRERQRIREQLRRERHEPLEASHWVMKTDAVDALDADAHLTPTFLTATARGLRMSLALSSRHPKLPLNLAPGTPSS